MWLRFLINYLCKGAAAVLLLALAQPIGSRETAKRVILITIDGMRPEMISDSCMPSPYLKAMKKDGLFVKRVAGIPPTSTYPSHTTIVTGARPMNHRIYYNSPFVFNRDSTVSYWYADSIGCPTIWQKARENGLTTASLFWPVSTGCRFIDYNIPEYWSVEPVPDQVEFIKPYCTPSGIFEELEREAVGRLSQRTFAAGSIDRDARTAYMANYLLNRYRPALMTIHLITTDYAQHATGLKSDRVYQAVASADHAVGLILENLQRNGMLAETAVIVCGDHGFTDTSCSIVPNVWLVQERLLSEKPGGDWEACFHISGATAFLYLRNPADRKTLASVRKKLGSLPEATRRLFRVVEREELVSLGASPDVHLALEPVVGVGVTAARTGNDVVQKWGGKHGYLSGIDPTALLAYGCGVRKRGEAEVLKQTDIAPYVMYLLGIECEFPDGTLPAELVE